MNYHVTPIGGGRWGIFLTHLEGCLYISANLGATVAKAEKLAVKDKVVLYIHDQTAIVGYTSSLNLTGEVSYFSYLPVRFTTEELEKLDRLYFQIWEGARQRQRKEGIDNLLKELYPNIVKEREAFRQFLLEGNSPSVTAFRKWLN